MFVEPGLLRLGANESHHAGERAQQGADHLGRGPLVATMFGDFAAAAEFHEAVISAHAQHVTNLRAHREALCAVGAKAHNAAAEFTAMDERNADQLRGVCGAAAASAPRR